MSRIYGPGAVILRGAHFLPLPRGWQDFLAYGQGGGIFVGKASSEKAASEKAAAEKTTVGKTVTVFWQLFDLFYS